MIQETVKALTVVQEMLTAFGKGDLESLKQTLSEDTVWIYHGVDGIPYNGTYQGKEGAVNFIMNIMNNVDILDFQITKMIADQNTVVVLGSEKQKIKNNSEVLEQKWVQVYTVENNLITRLEEFSNTAFSFQLFQR
ncbi:nuclear transport factor 2 family protein [Chitinophaga tropicalis]|uniref:Nuclear transport factor 2 family protein n=1 Tax=Chitinophaga tropicalis TaxID=2683588 RepID=A0A7K1UAD3_9BACT|nr:nuclear transport factor 2 family protein [Chitinophaga tropicalis]MVT11327.1 nuclear transport factor 2 family protein [Chitinophaga tropicalis]